jgi:hypothetical protein
MASKLAALALLLALIGCVAHTCQASYGFPYPLSAPRQRTPATPALNYAHYYKTCKGAEKIVRDVVQEEIKRNRGIGAGLIRLFFHDCFVQVSIVICKQIDLSFCSLLIYSYYRYDLKSCKCITIWNNKFIYLHFRVAMGRSFLTRHRPMNEPRSLASLT